MRKLFFIPIIFFLVIACLEPEHDNVYDPDNPDKARVVGIVRGYSRVYDHVRGQGPGVDCGPPQ